LQRVHPPPEPDVADGARGATSSPHTDAPMPAEGAADSTLTAPSERKEELRSFLFFTVVMAPVIAVLLVASYGFVIWMYQLVAGPPGA
jgi:periplasmic nitrate reductase NapE